MSDTIEQSVKTTQNRTNRNLTKQNKTNPHTHTRTHAHKHTHIHSHARTHARTHVQCLLRKHNRGHILLSAAEHLYFHYTVNSSEYTEGHYRNTLTGECLSTTGLINPNFSYMLSFISPWVNFLDITTENTATGRSSWLWTGTCNLKYRCDTKTEGMGDE